MLTWQQAQNKFVRLSRDTTPGALEQAKEDMNTGYHMFNAKLARYWSRKQQFTDVITGQGIYQTPIDCVRIIGMTVKVSDTYQVPIKEIRSEFEWRNITAYPYDSNWPAYYYMIGNDQFQLWPTPSQDVNSGLRFYYQQQDHDLSVDDTVSTPSTLVSLVNGSPVVTSTASAFTPQMTGLHFQNTGVTDLTWYEIVEVPDDKTLVLKSAFIGYTGNNLSWRIGQIPIIPEEYHDSIVNYALYLYFSGKGNETRAGQHLSLFNTSIEDAIEAYSSSTQGNVITDDDNHINSWFVTPLPGPGV